MSWSWIIGIVALSLVMTVLTAVELRQPIKANAFSTPDVVLLVIMFAFIFLYGLILLGIHILP